MLPNSIDRNSVNTISKNRINPFSKHFLEFIVKENFNYYDKLARTIEKIEDNGMNFLDKFAMEEKHLMKGFTLVEPNICERIIKDNFIEYYI